MVIISDSTNFFKPKYSPLLRYVFLLAESNLIFIHMYLVESFRLFKTIIPKILITLWAYVVFKIVKTLMLNVWPCTYFPNATTQMRGQMESHLQELEHVRDSLTAAERKLHECQERLQHCKGKCADQAHTVRELQGQVSRRLSAFY